MSTTIADGRTEDLEDLVSIYSSPHLYHNREEAGWSVKSFFDYHRIKVIKHQERIIGTVFWNVMEEKHREHSMLEYQISEIGQAATWLKDYMER